MLTAALHAVLILGLLAAFATIGKAEAAYFEMINDNGGRLSC